MDAVEREAQSLLQPLREFEPEGSGAVDIAGAVRRGRRVHRARMAVCALGAVVAVVAGALVLPSLTHRAQAPAAPAPGEFSVLRQEFRVESAAGYDPRGYLTGRFQQSAYLGSGRSDAMVTFFAAGQVPFPGWTPQGDTTDPVSGTASPAYYLAKPVLGSGVELAWQWAPGAWAIVDVAAARRDVGADRAAARQIAEHAYRGPGAAVRTPFSVAAPPAGLHLVEVMVLTGPGEAVANLAFGSSDEGPRDLVVGVRTKAVADDGEHALGHGLVASVGGGLPPALAQQVLDSVRLSVGPDPADTAHWTTSPIR